jgi:hypothetical protein
MSKWSMASIVVHREIISVRYSGLSKPQPTTNVINPSPITESTAAGTGHTTSDTRETLDTSWIPHELEYSTPCCSYRGEGECDPDIPSLPEESGTWLLRCSGHHHAVRVWPYVATLSSYVPSDSSKAGAWYRRRSRVALKQHGAISAKFKGGRQSKKIVSTVLELVLAAKY